MHLFLNIHFSSLRGWLDYSRLISSQSSVCLSGARRMLIARSQSYPRDECLGQELSLREGGTKEDSEMVDRRDRRLEHFL